ncbi:MAG: HAMP domain-containing protein, partial [Alphaproteobacteria bacterium]
MASTNASGNDAAEILMRAGKLTFALTIRRRFFLVIATACAIMLAGTGYAVLSFRSQLIDMHERTVVSQPYENASAHDAAIAAIDSDIISVLIRLALVCGPFGVAFFVMALWLARGISRPLNELTGSLKQLADGDLDAEVGGGSRGDEVGAIARAVTEFRERLKANAAEKIAQESAKKAAQYEMMARQASAFQDEMLLTINRVCSMASDLKKSANGLGHAAGSTQQLT